MECRAGDLRRLRKWKEDAGASSEVSRTESEFLVVFFFNIPGDLFRAADGKAPQL